MSLRDQIVKLAYDNPGEVRDALLPILKKGAKNWQAPGVRPNQVGWSTAHEMLDELVKDLGPVLRGFKVEQSRSGTRDPRLSMYQGEPIPGTGVIGAKELSVRFMGNKWLVGAYNGLDSRGNEIYDSESVRSEFPDLGGYDALLRAAKKMAQKLVR